ncbi:MFS transporter [Ralstonia solanacearum]|nr:MFS transporter [Ralstonia solanacearum]
MFGGANSNNIDMSIAALFPVQGNHAIQQAAFVVEWPTPLTDATLQSIVSLHTQLKDVFPILQTPRQVQIAFGAHGGVDLPVTTSDALGGVHFVRPDPQAGPAGVVRAMQISRENLVVLINNYTRWDTVWQEVSSWLALVLPFVLDGRPITGATLQYIDKFSWRSDPTSLPLAEIFSHDTCYLPKNAFEAKGLWHAHHGFISHFKEPFEYDCVDNVNINLLPEAASLALQIVTSHKGTLKNPVWDVTEARAAISTLMDGFHARNKEILRDLFTKAVREKIGLI